MGCRSRRRAGRLTLVEDRFANLDTVARDHGATLVDGVVLDIGVSSMQLDTPERGFSFRLDGPLDMRMGSAGTERRRRGQCGEPNATSPISSTFSARNAARAPSPAPSCGRGQGAGATTTALADIVASVVRGKPNDIHPATRTFQALRIFVNDELGELVQALVAAERILKPDGRLVVVSFHSLEDRIVKTFLAGAARRAPARATRPKSSGRRRPSAR